MKTRIKTAARALTRAEVESYVGAIREAKIEEQALLAEREQHRKKIDAEFAPELETLAEHIAFGVEAVRAWAEAHPDEFAKRKSIEFTHGTIGFRTGTPKVVLLNRKWNWEMVLDSLNTTLPEFVRTKLEPDKDAIIKTWTTDESMRAPFNEHGLKVVQDESFFVEPKLEQPEARETARAERRALPTNN